MEIKVGLQVYVIGLLSFIGWFFFVVFGGIGLSALPLDLILAFRDRPRAISEQVYRLKRRSLGLASTHLIAKAEEMQNEAAKLGHVKGWALRRKQREVKSTYNRFKRDCHLLETEFENLQVSKVHKGENLAVSITKLLLGIMCAILSLVWVIHIILSVVVPHFSPATRIHFLDAVFAAIERSGLYPLSVALFAVFSLYLLVCVVKGCLKFGMRVFVVFSVHPMSHKATPLNSILFNVEMVLLTSAAVVHFARTAFSDYARLTGADVIFEAQIKHLSFFRFFFKHNIFIYALLCCFLISLIYLLRKPRDNRELINDPKADRQIAAIIGAPVSLREAAQGAIEMPSMPLKPGVKGGA